MNHQKSSPTAVGERRRRVLGTLAVASAVLLLGACNTTVTGMGGGELIQTGKTEKPVLISWTSKSDGLSGIMVATLPKRTYQGPFFEITSQTSEQSLSPLWEGWNTGWYDWPYWSYPVYGPYDTTRFVTNYSGKVVSNLSAPDGSRMRCRLHLAQPASGMKGGGQGECQLSTGGTVQAEF